MTKNKKQPPCCRTCARLSSCALHGPTAITDADVVSSTEGRTRNARSAFGHVTKENYNNASRAPRSVPLASPRLCCTDGRESIAHGTTVRQQPTSTDEYITWLG
ncbi:hypothetical protein PLESTB_000575000 [Pleodorina starrii]|uniref:Uncharacterized protein n=1 Tax=Pleodorina starrii TaxID=330485 RepID=A0A9W6F0P4_9CHLO|nr:hypothetical protein PLESTB_000575000 [Pleodorina starrii]GLC72173.1 hypothetical protein PLESTF_001214900 [Pleodorina starrii]